MKSYSSNQPLTRAEINDAFNRAELAADVVRNSLANLELLASVKDDLRELKNLIKRVEKLEKKNG